MIDIFRSNKIDIKTRKELMAFIETSKEIEKERKFSSKKIAKSVKIKEADLQR